MKLSTAGLHGAKDGKLILHSFRRCPFAIRVRMALEEKGLEYKIIEEDLSSPSQELLTMHPEGRVPLLIHEQNEQKHIIYQSTIITEYLDEAFPFKPIMPNLDRHAVASSEAVSRAKVRLLTYWCDSIFKPDLDLYKYDFPHLSE